MSIFEYDEEKELQLLLEAERKQWLQDGIKLGNEENIRNLMETMKLNIGQAMNALKIPTEEQAVYAAKINKT